MRETSIVPSQSAVLRGDHWRITVLTPCLIRLEYSHTGSFTDGATQMVVNRNFPLPEFRVSRGEGRLVVNTEFLRLTYDEKPFSPTGLTIQVAGQNSCYSAVWHYGDRPDSLKGTARTLDMADGAIDLEDGVLSAGGWSLLSDKGSALVAEDGSLMPRPDREAEDLYFFGYGRDYLQCLKDFHRLTGPVPLLPRYALGNWWSRYYRYDQAAYLSLMDRFARENLPFTVSVIDMDWHITDIDPKYGTGWTGYTWNRDLFPDPEGFLAALKDRGLHTTLNLHPADGIRAYEEGYREFARWMGMDPSREDPIEFRPADPKFMEGYFRFILHPMEDGGVDFWWVDWQQGTNSGAEGLDPLWLLNHCHYLDHSRRHDRGMIFSRYAGPGSHRYPIGFSGDSIASWASLDFQPYFTATASNIGYGWWSHDIGGHMLSRKDDQLALRWMQFGVFSPIFRLHSCNNEFYSKEPWQYNPIAASVMADFLRLRHRLIPYLYSMNRRAAVESLPLCQPMYHHYPYAQQAYRVPNEYTFGTELIVCPITTPEDPESGLASFTAWLPEGQWVDFFTGLRYQGGRTLRLYRLLDSIPVLARAGGIVPMDGRLEGNACDNPDLVELRVFAGADGSFTLWEDEGGRDSAWAATEVEFIWGGEARLTIRPPRGSTAAIPAGRGYRLRLYGLDRGAAFRAASEGGPAASLEALWDEDTGSCLLTLPRLPLDRAVHVTISQAALGDNNVQRRVFALLHRAQISYDLKSAIQELVGSGRGAGSVLSQLMTMGLSRSLMEALAELLTAAE